MSGSLILLLGAAALVALVHSLLPDHWVPLAVVGRAQGWSLARVARVSGFAATGHVLASLALAGLVALVGLRFQAQIESQQGHIVGAVLVLTGLALLAWGATGHGHAHDHGPAPESAHDHGDGLRSAPHSHGADPGHEPEAHEHDPHWHDRHEHEHAQPAGEPDHRHQHEHEGRLHSHPHSHEEFLVARQTELFDVFDESRRPPTFGGRLATFVVPFGVAASPDLTILPIALAASAHGRGAVAGVLILFAVITVLTFVALTVAGAAVGYEMRGRWLEEHANTATSLVLVGVGLVAFFGF